ncbi:MAG: MATE family efflux transporter [Bacteroidetes bacterium]|nr:MATE family efflux transporter [Bacteroidota bacterium]
MLEGESLSGKNKKLDLKGFFTRGHSRSIRAKKNILALACIKGVSVLTSFVLVPLTINYLSPVNYGIWLTLYSIVSWFGLLDVGLGNGLRNKFAEAVAGGDKQSARVYLSTSYAMLGAIMTLACIAFLAVNMFLDWSSILNVPAEKKDELRKVMAVIFGSFCMQLVVKLVSSMLLAVQRAAVAGAINTVCSILSLAAVYILTKTTMGSLLYLALAVGIINIVVPLAVSFWFYGVYYKEYAPAWKYVNFSYARKLMDVGVMFFLFQSTALIVVATDNLIISRLYGAEEVTPYNIALKYFTPVTVAFSIISTPLWSAYTEAYAQHDMAWIRRITTKMMKIWVLVFLAVIPMIFLAGFVYRIWVGKDIQIPLALSASMGLYVLLSSWNQIFGNFINGVGKMRVAFYLTIITAIVNIPLCIILAKYCHMGVTGIILASCISLVPDIIVIPIQYYKIIHNKAGGIWNK